MRRLRSRFSRCLDRVTEPGGTATLAQVRGFSVGGKTGTVHKVGQGGYLDDQYVALFVGIAPMDSPRYVTAVLIDQPRGDHYGGGLAAAPVYSRITEEVLRIRNARPDRAGMSALLAASGVRNDHEFANSAGCADGA